MTIAVVPQFGWPPYLQTKLAAAYLGVSRFQLYRAVAAGQLTPIARKGRVMVFEREALDRYLLGDKPQSAPPELRIVGDSEKA